MSDVLQVEPPPPPPPPPPAPPSNNIDFVRPFAFAFEDPRWLPKFLMGALFALATVILVGIPFLFGYLARLARNVIAGMQRPLPEWDDLGEYFAEGLRLFAVGFVYVFPLIVISMVLVVPAIIAQGHFDEDSFNKMMGESMVGCVWCLIFPFSMALTIWLPAALLMTSVERTFAAAFDFRRIARFIRDNAVNYIIAFVIWLIVRFASSLGLILCCVGVFITAFWSYVVGTYAFAETYRLSQRR